MNNCTFPTCTKPVIAKGYCMTHYRRLLRNGTLEPKTMLGIKNCTKCGKSGKVTSGLCDHCYYLSRKSKKIVAHQYKIREKLSKSHSGDKFWEEYNLDVSQSIIRPISHKEAKEIIEKYEYLGGLAAINLYYFGLFFKHKIDPNKELLSGAVIFGTDYGQNTGSWDKFVGNILLLNRGACAFWCPKNSNSHLIMGAIKQLPIEYTVITATVDSDAGERGIIYQSCNFHYVGVMRKTKQRLSVIIDGKKYSSLSARKKFGTIGKEKLSVMFPDAIFVEGKSKARYFYFRGSKKQKKYNLSQIIEKPYSTNG